MSTFKVIIVGGGLSGALLANGLINHDIDAVVYERDAEGSKREGYQIRLGESSLTGFRACLTGEHMQSIINNLGQSSGDTAGAPTIFNSRFEEIIDLGILPTYARSSAMNRVVLRDALLEPIKKKGRMHYEKGFQRYDIVEERGRERVRVAFSDGSSDTCDVLVGADGSGSRINSQLGANNLVTIESHMPFVYKGDVPQHRLQKLPKCLHKGPMVVFTNKASLYYALYLPQDYKDKTNESEGTSDLAYDETAASFFWGFHIPKSEVPYASPSQVQNAWQLCMDKMDEWGWAQELKDLVRIGSEDNKAGVTPIVGRASNQLPKDWRSKVRSSRSDAEAGHPRVWLIGDAVHAMQPNRGQGGNQAMHDAADILPELLALNDITLTNKALSTQDFQAACARYESRMFDRAFPWVKKSGGTALPSLDLDGYLGTFLKCVSWTVLPAVRFVCKIVGIKG
ncbi:hypothetical protein FB567DRAFT_627737 [Paraphoma chrysanthemicola]|uniref:FAD-binding domain-containing protein n=1 Tax=Paraphoma chrysanthemicola TaxID=798071 RepID=A0A8K0R9W7_9PLEO|nr:hypothetical protein FB567DRAFT_627737 [Paraphoma chrysanthemicola]